MTDILIFLDRNAFGFFIIIIALIAVFYWLVKAFIERNKPACQCDCCDEDPDDDEVIEEGEQEDEDE